MVPRECVDFGDIPMVPCLVCPVAWASSLPVSWQAPAIRHRMAQSWGFLELFSAILSSFFIPFQNLSLFSKNLKSLRNRKSHSALT